MSKRMASMGLAVLAAAVMLLSACSSSGKSGDTAGKTGAGSPSSTLTGAPIRVGTICSCSGVQAATEGLDMKASQAWAAWTNDHGGINGHPIKLYTADDSENPATALEQVKSLIENDHVIAIVGETSLVDADWASYASSKGVPVIGGETADAPMSSDPNFFASGATFPVQQFAQFLIMKQRNLSHFGIFYCAESPICAQIVGLAKGLSTIAGGGISVTGVNVAATTPNYAAQCSKFNSAGVDAVFMGVGADVGHRVGDQCAQSGFKPLIFASTNGTFNAGWLKDNRLAGVLVTGSNANYLNPSVPAVKTMTDAFEKYEPGMTSSKQYAGNDEWAWVGGLLFTAAAKAGNLSPTSTAADVKKGLYALKDETLGGMAPPLNYTEGKASPPACSFLFEMKDQQLMTSSPATVCLSSTQTESLLKLVAG